MRDWQKYHIWCESNKELPTTLHARGQFGVTQRRKPGWYLLIFFILRLSSASELSSYQLCLADALPFQEATHPSVMSLTDILFLPRIPERLRYSTKQLKRLWPTLLIWHDWSQRRDLLANGSSSGHLPFRSKLNIRLLCLPRRRLLLTRL